MSLRFVAARKGKKKEEILAFQKKRQFVWN